MLAILLFRLSMLVLLSGLCVAVWGFSKSDKMGYIFVAIFFMLMLALHLYTGPFRPVPTDPELQAKIDQTITEYLQNLQTESAGSEIEPRRVSVSARFMVLPSLLSLIASVILVIGLWFLAWAEPKDDPESSNILS